MRIISKCCRNICSNCCNRKKNIFPVIQINLFCERMDVWDKKYRMNNQRNKLLEAIIILTIHENKYTFVCSISRYFWLKLKKDYVCYITWVSGKCPAQNIDNIISVRFAAFRSNSSEFYHDRIYESFVKFYQCCLDLG